MAPKSAASEAAQPQLVPGAVPPSSDEVLPTRVPAAGIAARLVALHAEIGARGLLHIARSENEAEETARAFRCFRPDVEVLVLPPWDCLPYDRTAPQRDCMGRRMAVFEAIDGVPAKPRLLVTSPMAVLQTVPPRETVRDASFALAVGDTLDRDALDSFLKRAGYILDDRVDEAGEAALLGDVVDIFPAAAASPFRIVLADDRIEDIRNYDPTTQRTEGSVESLRVGPASEYVPAAGDEDTDLAAGPSMEARMSALYGDMDALLDRLSGFAVSTVAQTEDRLDTALDLIKEARQARRDFGENHTKVGDGYYLDKTTWKKALKSGKPVIVDVAAIEAVPRFPLQSQPQKAFGRFVADQAQAGMRVLVTGVGPELKRLLRTLARTLEGETTSVETWEAVVEAAPGSVLTAAFDLSAGFTDLTSGIVVIAAPDVFGARLFGGEATDSNALLTEPELRVGDVVIHEDHGVGILRALERVTVEGVELDAVRLEYHGGASLLAPIGEFGRIWRYGAEAEAVKLDRLNTDGWFKRRLEVSAAIDKAAADLVAAAKARAEQKAEPIVPPRAAFAQFAARFPYPETPDQAAAIEAVLADLASGKVMNRLICGDVGFGKTEIALRASAAAALAGKQVAVVAPTTVLVRQHFETFQRRFADTGITVGHLSRVTAGAEMDATKAGLKSGEIGIVVATQAVVSNDVEFADLGLLVIDEEHRFGAKLKEAMRALAPTLHTLTMSATPIPRTLQSAMVGVQDVSVLASPPARRRPIRTFLAPFDAASVKTALIREKRRGGQSFLVAPRIEDLGEIEALLATLVPDFDLRVAHGKMDAREMDDIMVAFAAGEGDVLLSTNIIESGLDVPRANTMLVWRADRFGLAQLHQLRGRVGRGRAQGVTYLLTDSDAEIPDATRSRLSTLVAFDRLGSGLAISARDLDLRGAGDLMGEEQAGHMKLIGVSLYQWVLAQAVEASRAESGGLVWEPEINLEVVGSIPADYVPEPTVRLNLYARLLRMTRVEEIEAFLDEIADRFGEPPEPVTVLLDLARLKIIARAGNVARVHAGPRATALSFRKPLSDERWSTLLKDEDCSRREDRLIVAQPTEPGPERLQVVQRLLEAVA